MKTISRYIMTLALLITAASGAWAEEEVLLTTITATSIDTYSETTAGVVTVSHDNNYFMDDYGWIWMGKAGSLTVEAKDGYTITKCVFRQEVKKPVTVSSAPFKVNFVETHPDEFDPNNVIYLCEGTDPIDHIDGVSSIEVYGYAAPASSDVEVTTNAEEGETTFTEATFQMPAYDATAEYELVRDMSYQMTAQVGDGTQEQPRYRVKKDGNNKFIPADMEMAAVPALFTVNDAIEQKALTQTQDYIVQIYPVDAEGQPTGAAPMTLATFTFEPGIYAVKAVAAQGSDYDGETALSNTFKLFQGYEVQVAAKEFITYYKDEPLYADTETSADAELYTIQSVSADQATLSAAIQTAPSLTPLLIFNNSDQAKTFLLIPANEEPNLALTVAPEFQGTLTGTTIAASTDAQTNYALNGTAFVFVKNAIEVGPNKAWLSISNSNARMINLVFDETTKITNTNITNLTNGNWYDLNGRKLDKMPTKKGIYIMNGRKVVVK